MNGRGGWMEAASRAQVVEKDGEIRLKATPFTCKAVIKGVYAEPTGAVFSQIHSPVLLLRSALPSASGRAEPQPIRYL